MKPLLALEHLDVSFGSAAAVNKVSITIGRGETLALVGESGSGKTVTALAALGLLPETAAIRGTIRFDGESVIDEKSYHADLLRRIRGKRIGMVFQEPMTALNPLHSVGRQIGEGLTKHLGLDGAALKKRIHELLTQVGLEELQHRLDAYPHQLSGGQRQRVMIAMAIACGPDLLIADEPTTALDAHLRGQICDLLKKLQAETGMALLFITHDLRLVRRLAHRVIVMRHGDIVEQGEVDTVFANPKNDYTRLLLDATPKGQPAPIPKDTPVILKASDIHVHYALARNLWGTPTRFQEAVEHVSLTLHIGETLGIVGESGSGKSSLGMALLRLQKADGSIVFEDKELIGKPLSAIRHLRKAFQVIFQDPFSSLNPRFSAGELVVEGLNIHEPALSPAEREARLEAAFTEVGLDSSMRHRYPHEFSGGQRQRLAIARALILKPKLLILDEPTSALDVSVQAQVLALLKELQRKYGLAYIFISHDLEVVRAMSHRVLVLHEGKMVEEGEASAVFTAPSHAYTRALVAEIQR